MSNNVDILTLYDTKYKVFLYFSCIHSSYVKISLNGEIQFVLIRP